MGKRRNMIINLFKEGRLDGCHSPIVFNTDLNAYLHYEVMAKSVFCYRVNLSVIPVDGPNLYEVSAKETVERVYSSDKDLLCFVKENGWLINHPVLQEYSNDHRDAGYNPNLLMRNNKF